MSKWRVTKFKVQILAGKESWNETYDAKTDDPAMEAIEMVHHFNATLKPGEKRRKLEKLWLRGPNGYVRVDTETHGVDLEAELT